MPTIKITCQVGKLDFACVVPAELATMSFVSNNVANTVAIIHSFKYPEGKKKIIEENVCSRFDLKKELNDLEAEKD
ncbi:hypothetical protein TNCV_5045231 [Trichonephila clavipes]|uniref:Uncharacterized protein n=1 Tax=Trichonephila clavipes TaxID=2585209 RepID=A0A8X7BL37_TRICX|nr:hypothetical protein TNCV_5045231 [Trichonephila clavipes]